MTVQEAVPISIEASNCLKTTYIIGEEFDPSGIVLTVTYNNGKTEQVAGGFDYSPKIFDKAGPLNVTITYGGKATMIGVLVNDRRAAELKVYQSPYKLEYTVGDMLDQNGLQVLVRYNNGEEQIVSGGAFECYPVVLDTEGTQFITVSYAGLTTAFTVQVNHKHVFEYVQTGLGTHLYYCKQCGEVSMEETCEYDADGVCVKCGFVKVGGSVVITVDGPPVQPDPVHTYEYTSTGLGTHFYWCTKHVNEQGEENCEYDANGVCVKCGYHSPDFNPQIIVDPGEFIDPAFPDP